VKLWGWDTETFLFRLGLPTPKLVCGSWADAEREWIGNPEETSRFFVETLERGDHLVGVNVAYDVVVMAAHRPNLLPLIFQAGNAGLFHDCPIREALHDIAIDKLFIDHKTGKSFAKEDLGGRYSMAVLMDRHFDQDISAEKEGDVWRYKYASLDGVPIAQWPKAAVDYPLQDARRTYDICVKQKNHKNKHDEAAQVRASIAIQLMVTWGFRTDRDYVAHLDQEVDQVWNEAREEFSKAGIYRADGTKDTKRLADMVVSAYSGNPPKTPTGKISTDRDTLLDSGDPILEKLGSAGKNDKRKTVYIPALKKGIDVPINPQFNVLVDTGRVSSDWQQMPQKGGIREGAIARPDTVNASLDYGGLELRTMSQRAILDKDVGFSKMAEFINAGKDVHTYAGANFLRCSYESLKARVDAKDPEAVNFRALGKEFNFSKGGGSGAGGLAYGAKKKGIRFCLLAGRAKRCGEKKQVVMVRKQAKHVCSLCVEVAKELGDIWLKAWPEQGLLFAKASRLTAGKRKVDSVTFGSNRVRGGCGYTQWLNTPFQGAGGDGMKRAMWRIEEQQYTNRRSPLWGSHLLLNVHDELWIEFPDDQRRHDGAFEAARIMVDEMNLITPDVQNECVPAIMRRMFKAASDVYDKQGRLKPWWPADWAWKPDQEVMERDRAA
jgi:DNA polymerase-1